MHSIRINRNTGSGQTAGNRRRTLLIAGAAALFLLLCYLGLSIYFQKHFVFRTTINGVGVSGASEERVKEKITEQIDGYTLELEERGGGQETIAGADIAMRPVFDDTIADWLKQQNGFAWPYYLFHPSEYEAPTMVEYDDAALEAALGALDCMDEERWTESEDARILEYTAEGYEIAEAVYGTRPDVETVGEKVREALEGLEPELDMEKAGCYVEPEVTEEDEVFTEALETLNRYTGFCITYEGPEEPMVLDGETISQWLSVDEEYHVVVDSDAMGDFVKTLARKYNTVFGNRQLDTSYGQTITIYGGNYGWWIDNGAEKEMILEDMKIGEDVSREPVYIQKANSYGEQDYGDTYVEINLTAQHLFFYKDGKLLVESDFVSGNVAKNHATPTGSFRLTYKTRDATLRGEDYASDVSFWMPFNGDVGMHDAGWRNTFGGDIYKTGGSHGCINLPYSAAQTIYENIEAGDPVLVYELPGTEPVSPQEPAAPQEPIAPQEPVAPQEQVAPQEPALLQEPVVLQEPETGESQAEE